MRKKYCFFDTVGFGFLMIVTLQATDIANGGEKMGNIAVPRPLARASVFPAVEAKPNNRQ